MGYCCPEIGGADLKLFCVRADSCPKVCIGLLARTRLHPRKTAILIGVYAKDRLVVIAGSGSLIKIVMYKEGYVN